MNPHEKFEQEACTVSYGHDDPHYIPEAELRLSLANERDNSDILKNYNDALCSGAYRWAMNGGKGSMFECIKQQMIEKGVVK